MTTVAITAGNGYDQDNAVDVLTRAFEADPAARWAYPDTQQYHRCFPKFVRVFSGKAFAQGTAYCIDAFLGVALWLPPNVHPDEEALAALIGDSVTDGEREDVAAYLDDLGRYHPSEPHWYLPLIGVAPTHHRRGFGTALMRHALQACDRDGKLAYLAATSAESKTLYEREGFRQIGTVQVGRSPEVYPMVREPQRKQSILCS